MTPTNLSREIDWESIGEPDCHEDVSVRIAGCDTEDSDGTDLANG